jgi:tetratricopeptide (TPR) repeat protein
MKRIGKHILLLMLVVVSLHVSAINPDSLIVRANRAYDQQQYDSAIIMYQRVLKQGLVSPKLYFNLGDAYYRKKDMPSAILYFEKARKLDPNNADLQYNLNLANTMIPDKIVKVPEMFLKRWWNYFYNLFDANTWAVLSLISLAIFVLLVGIFILSRGRSTRKISFFIGILMLLVTVAAFGLASQKSYYMQHHNEAIIFTPTITAKSSPTANSVDLFVIHQGTKVRLMDEVDGWEKIKLQNGSIGWLPKQSMKKI